MKKTAKMKKTLMAVALAFGVGAWAADTARVTAPGGATADYATLQAALNGQPMRKERLTGAWGRGE